MKSSLVAQEPYEYHLHHCILNQLMILKKNVTIFYAEQPPDNIISLISHSRRIVLWQHEAIVLIFTLPPLHDYFEMWCECDSKQRSWDLK
jgi:hypothetical protein